MSNQGRTSILRDSIGRGRIRHWNMLADALEIGPNIFPMPTGRPPLVEYLRRVGLEKHPVEDGVAAKADALKGEGRFGELVRRPKRHVRYLRVLAGHVENRQVAAIRREPRREVGAADRRGGRAAGFDNQYPLALSYTTFTT